MSAPAPPSTDLARARRHLERKGYLRGGLPPSPPAAWRRITFVLALWVAVSATVVGGALARSGAGWAQVKVVALAVAPPVLLVFLTALLVGRLAAVRLRAWGGTPQSVARALGGAAPLLALGGIAGVLHRRVEGCPVLTWAPGERRPGRAWTTVRLRPP